jgi:hypothetical protein
LPDVEVIGIDEDLVVGLTRRHQGTKFFLILIFAPLAVASKVAAMNTSTPTQREGWYAVRCHDLEDMRRQNIAYWQRAGGAAIRQAAWELVQDWWEMKKKDPDELRFQRVAPSLRQK